jgi:quercetin dioxygenase-like cupin family protein
VQPVVWTPPDIKHRHGATPEGSMTHLTITAEIDGRVVDWLEQVTDAEYQSCAARQG